MLDDVAVDALASDVPAARESVLGPVKLTRGEAAHDAFPAQPKLNGRFLDGDAVVEVVHFAYLLRLS